MQVDSTLSKKVTLRILLACALIGVGVVIFGVVEWGRAKAAERWPTVEGTVVSAEIRRHRSTSGSGGNRTRSFTPDITYRYVVLGEEYTSNRVMFAQYSSNTESDIRPILRKYPRGSLVTVYHHPRRPELSVLEPGLTIGNYIIPLIGVVWLLGSLGFYWFFAKYMPEDGAQAETAPTGSA